MNKLAVFVEGYTEVVFVEKLIEEIAGETNVLIEHREIRGGGSKRRTFARVRAAKPDTGQQYFVMIIDCGGDHLVKERVLNRNQVGTRSFSSNSGSSSNLGQSRSTRAIGSRLMRAMKA